MYKTFYNLNIDPFKPQAGRASYYQPEPLRHLLENLASQIEDNHGLFILTSEEGIGKSSFVNMLLYRLQESCICSLVQLAGEEKNILFGDILTGFSIPSKFKTKVEFILQLTNHLQKIHKQGKKALLIIDNAQLLTVPLLDEIRQLINLQQDNAGLLSVLLVGQSKTAGIVEAALSASFKKKVVTHVHVEPLTAQQVGEYINHRLKLAGCSTPLFEPDTTEYIHAITAGNVKKINLLCETSLLLGHRRDEKQITKSLIKEAALQLRMITSPETAGATDNSIETKTAPLSNPTAARASRKDKITKKERKPNGILLVIGLCLAVVATLYITQPEVRQQVNVLVNGLQTDTKQPQQGNAESNQQAESLPVSDTSSTEAAESSAIDKDTAATAEEEQTVAAAIQTEMDEQDNEDAGQDVLSDTYPQEDAAQLSADDQTDTDSIATTENNSIETTIQTELEREEDIAQDNAFDADSEKEELTAQYQSDTDNASTTDDTSSSAEIEEDVEETGSSDIAQVDTLKSESKEARGLPAEYPDTTDILAEAESNSAIEATQAEKEENVEQSTTIQQSTSEASETTTEAVNQNTEIVAKPAQIVVQKVVIVSSEDEKRVPSQPPLHESTLFTDGKISLETKPNSSQITDQATELLTRFAEELKQHPAARIKITGFIASVRNSPENIKLSEKRAQLVQTQLIDLGVNPEQLETEGLGNQHPIGDNTTAEGRKKNRRVEISILEEEIDS